MDADTSTDPFADVPPSTDPLAEEQPATPETLPSPEERLAPGSLEGDNPSQGTDTEVEEGEVGEVEAPVATSDEPVEPEVEEPVEPPADPDDLPAAPGDEEEYDHAAEAEEPQEDPEPEPAPAPAPVEANGASLKRTYLAFEAIVTKGKTVWSQVGTVEARNGPNALRAAYRQLATEREEWTDITMVVVSARMWQPKPISPRERDVPPAIDIG